MFGLDDKDPNTRILLIAIGRWGGRYRKRPQCIWAFATDSSGSTTSRRPDGFFGRNGQFEAPDVVPPETIYRLSKLPDVATISNALTFWEGTVNAMLEHRWSK